MKQSVSDGLCVADGLGVAEGIFCNYVMNNKYKKHTCVSMLFLIIYTPTAPHDHLFNVLNSDIPIPLICLFQFLNVFKLGINVPL